MKKTARRRRSGAERRGRDQRANAADPIALLPPLRRGYTEQEALAELDKLYSSLPALTCKGLCHVSCGVVAASELEHRRITAAGSTITPPAGETDSKDTSSVALANCPALGPLRNCTIYDIRPLICRVWGLGDRLRCPFGCVPDRVLSSVEVWDLIARIEQLSRHVTGVRAWPVRS
jgi:Fe-S-cluster containining protein